jgi:hypothetical protein
MRLGAGISWVPVEIVGEGLAQCNGEEEVSEGNHGKDLRSAA